jgi:zinc transporter ZupT
MRAGIQPAVAIGLHNFPEGLATFAALNDPRVGGVLAIAIAIHNIPEGLCALKHLLCHGQPLESLWLGRLVGCLGTLTLLELGRPCEFLFSNMYAVSVWTCVART